jgi:hypothetical protein
MGTILLMGQAAPSVDKSLYIVTCCYYWPEKSVRLFDSIAVTVDALGIDLESSRL